MPASTDASGPFGLVYEATPEWFPLPGDSGDDGQRPRMAHHDEPVNAAFELLETIEADPRTDAPVHRVIVGENFHALQRLLVEQGPASVDVIYIDPPYNTGARHWIYNDDFARGHHAYRPSAWLSFMERRLRLARELLKPSGLLFVAISDAAHARLRLLLDEVFGEANFGGNVVWQGTPSFLGKFTTGGLDYMLIYARERKKARKLTEPRPHAPEMLDIVARTRAAGGTTADAEKVLREFFTAHPEMPRGLSHYNRVDEHWQIFREAMLTNSLPRPTLRYPVTDPTTGAVHEPPANGWKVKREVMDELVATGQVIFANRLHPTRKLLLNDFMTQLPSPVFYQPRKSSALHLEAILGDKRFPFPKDHTVLMRWLAMAAPADGVILDFFGGSGSTTEAVMRLNAADGGARTSILVTNNEVGDAAAKNLVDDGHTPGDSGWEAAGVFEYVTRPRITTLVTGIRPDGNAYDGQVEANVSFEQLTYRT